jgi:hypothetical protein
VKIILPFTSHSLGKGEFSMEYKEHKNVTKDRLPALIAASKKKIASEEKRNTDI